MAALAALDSAIKAVAVSWLKRFIGQSREEGAPW